MMLHLIKKRTYVFHIEIKHSESVDGCFDYTIRDGEGGIECYNMPKENLIKDIRDEIEIWIGIKNMCLNH